MEAERGSMQESREEARGADRYRPLPLQTPDRVRAKRSGVTLPLH